MSTEALMKIVRKSILRNVSDRELGWTFFRYRENHVVFDRTWRHEGVLSILTGAGELHIKI